MKRFLLSCFAVAILVSSSTAQSLSLVYQDENVSNDTIYVPGNPSDDLIEFHLTVNNLTDKEIEVKVKKNEIFLVDNTVNTFCWGSCFMPLVYVSPVAIKIPALGSDAISFAGDFEPYGTEGTSIISYTFYNAQNILDSVMVTAFYEVGTSGIPDFMSGVSDVRIFPNPAADFINISFSREPEGLYSIKLLGMTGQLIAELVPFSRQKEQAVTLPRIPFSYAIIEIEFKDGFKLRKRILAGR